MTSSVYTFRLALLLLGINLILNGCSNFPKEIGAADDNHIVYPSSVSPIFDHFKLILGDGSNVGTPVNFENKDFQ